VSKPADLVQGTLDLLLLKILALEPLHGWAIGQRLKQVSGNILQVSDGSLYPALHKLEQEGWITAPMEDKRSRPARQILLTNTNGPETPREGIRELGTALDRN
jgi:DNA-binding PadR family transcriptional regulator